MNMKDYIDARREIDAKREALHKDLEKKGQALLSGELSRIFEQYPALSAVRWDQYTPHFNDGDPCTFGVGDPTVKWDGVDIDEEESGYDGGFVDEYCLPDSIPELEEAIDTLTKLQNDVGQAFYLATFGDHVRVTVTRDLSFDVEDYEHD